jgi:hypothetical protein
MPRGSEYRGPQIALEQYTAVVEASRADTHVRGAKNPYTSRNGHMFSFLDADGTMALRLPDEAGASFLSQFDSGPVTQYGSVMRGYVAVPSNLLADPVALATWFEESYDWIGTLEPKPTRK